MQDHKNLRTKATQAWKLPHILKGTLTWVPVLNRLRRRRAVTGGSDSPRYCYSVWLRHLVVLNLCGFTIKSAKIGELGPGDSIGIGLAALLSGASSYVGLDIMPFAASSNIEAIYDELLHLYSCSEQIPGENEFPLVLPKIDSYEFPNQLLDSTSFIDRADKIRRTLGDANDGQFISYRAPWTSLDDVSRESLDLIFSQAVLEHVDCLPEIYEAMSAWLKPGGYASHVIDFRAHHLSPFWNGHWAYSDWEWRLVRGRREFLLNRQPLSAHLACAEKAGFEVLLIKRDYDDGGIKTESLSHRFQLLDKEDARTRGVILILRKR